MITEYQFWYVFISAVTNRYFYKNLLSDKEIYDAKSKKYNS